MPGVVEYIMMSPSPVPSASHSPSGEKDMLWDGTVICRRSGNWTSCSSSWLRNFLRTCASDISLSTLLTGPGELVVRPAGRLHRLVLTRAETLFWHNRPGLNRFTGKLNTLAAQRFISTRVGLGYRAKCLPLPSSIAKSAEQVNQTMRVALSSSTMTTAQQL